NVAILGTRTGGGGRYTIAGPQFAGKAAAGTTLLLGRERLSTVVKLGDV
ncbi:MAG: hypothetical protein H7175_04735, partial [Burkholderiales bacterium]|nr:hypothetical protein [Anaerolineae bacterium]